MLLVLFSLASTAHAMNGMVAVEQSHDNPFASRDATKEFHDELVASRYQTKSFLVPNHPPRLGTFQFKRPQYPFEVVNDELGRKKKVSLDCQRSDECRCTLHSGWSSKPCDLMGSEKKRRDDNGNCLVHVWYHFDTKESGDKVSCSVASTFLSTDKKGIKTLDYYEDDDTEADTTTFLVPDVETTWAVEVRKRNAPSRMSSASSVGSDASGGQDDSYEAVEERSKLLTGPELTNYYAHELAIECSTGKTCDCAVRFYSPTLGMMPMPHSYKCAEKTTVRDSFGNCHVSIDVVKLADEATREKDLKDTKARIISKHSICSAIPIKQIKVDANRVKDLFVIPTSLSKVKQSESPLGLEVLAALPITFVKRGKSIDFQATCKSNCQCLVVSNSKPLLCTRLGGENESNCQLGIELTGKEYSCASNTYKKLEVKIAPQLMESAKDESPRTS